ncbi:hypothetical protein DC083_03840 [Ignatzschineria ureiclastica]|uniref:Uncharacterized protein n=1 Tax=Ignatzschineria ureiclastica TaxID=472582 RepID=A0A2U2AFZ4_9GAMM|nr:hypothetical protein [Ignatzschineria ureiclastica]PWD81576.1 hypothetical protein DC083_03840 [Ignatzschineria ureiclastica]GHA01775.1 hypothetical protein GCM10007162_17710 [Ignatzschineria ureiclastica]
MRASWQALRAFLQQDLRDYRLKDYDALPAKARWLLLGSASILFLFVVIMGWRVVWLHDWQSAQYAEKADLSRQIELLDLKNGQYQTFLTEERMQEVNLVMEQMVLDEEVNRDILNEIMGEMTSFTGEVRQFSPKLESLINRTNSDERGGYRTGIQRKSQARQAATSSIPYYLSWLWDNLGAKSQAERNLLDSAFERLNLTFDLCGNHEDLYRLLYQLSHISHYVMYVESLQWQGNDYSQKLCSSAYSGHLQANLHFYDLLQLSDYVPALLQDSTIELPRDIAQVSLSWANREKMSEKINEKMKEISQSLAQSQSAQQDSLTTGSRIHHLFLTPAVALGATQMEGRETLIWKVGDNYQGYRLMGLFVRGGKRYAIIAPERKLHDSQIITEGMFGLVTIDLPARQVILNPINKEEN